LYLYLYVTFFRDNDSTLIIIIRHRLLLDFIFRPAKRFLMKTFIRCIFSVKEYLIANVLLA